MTGMFTMYSQSADLGLLFFFPGVNARILVFCSGVPAMTLCLLPAEPQGPDASAEISGAWS